jgi:hypothetical protein
MELINVGKNDNCIIYYKIGELDFYRCMGFNFPKHKEIMSYYYSGYRTLLCIAYPKGKRPALPYPVNPSKNDNR